MSDYENYFLHDHQADELEAYQAKLDAKFHEIRASMDIHQYAEEIERDCFGGIGEKETAIHKALSDVFCGADGSHLSRLIEQYASDWLDAKATRMAVDALSGGAE